MSLDLAETLKQVVVAASWTDGMPVDVQITKDYILIKKGNSKQTYTLEELIAQCDLSAPPNKDLSEWEKS